MSLSFATPVHMKTSMILGMLLLSSCASNPPKPQEKQADTYKNVMTYPLQDGVAKVDFAGIENLPGTLNKTRAIHIILAVTNQSAFSSLEVNSKDLSVAFENGTHFQPLSANPQSMLIQPDGHFGMDLYFPLPKEIDAQKGAKIFNLHWAIKNEDAMVPDTFTQTTSFDLVSARDVAGNPPQDWTPPYDMLSGALFGGSAGILD